MIIEKISNFIQSATEKKWFKFAVLLHLGFAVFLFSPFFLYFRGIVGSTDNLFHHFPNMLFNLETFKNFDFGLWNPYVLNGIDFSASTHNFIQFPINWFIFLFPKSWFFMLMTLRMFFEVWLIGIFGYLFFREELNDKKWALFSSTIYQICGYTFFSITTYANLTIHLCIIISLYLIWTLNTRKAYLSYIYLTLLNLSIILSGNIVYSLAAMVIIVILFIYRFQHEVYNLLSKKIQIVYMSFISAIAVSMIRTLPVIHNILAVGDRISAMRLGGVAGYNYLALPLFIPEIFGVQFTMSMPMLTVLTHLQGLHVQFHGFTYFGAISALLVFFAVFFIKDKKILFWKIYLLLVCLCFLYVQPLSDILFAMVNPLIHTIVPKMMIPIPFCLVAGYAGLYLERNYKEIELKHIIVLKFLTAAVVLSAIMFFVFYRQDLLVRPFQVWIITIILVSSFIWSLKRYSGKKINKFLYYIFSLTIFLVTIFLFKEIFDVYETSAKFSGGCAKFIMFISGSIFMLAGLLYIIVKLAHKSLKKKQERTGLIIIGFILLSFFIFTPTHRLGLNIASLPAAALWGIFKMLLIIFIFLKVIMYLRKGKLNHNLLFVFLLLILTADLLPYNKWYSHQVTNPFFRGAALYPEKDYLINIKDDKESEVIFMDSFESWDSTNSILSANDWMFGGKKLSIKPDKNSKMYGKYCVEINNGLNEVANFYKDVYLKRKYTDNVFSLGMWIKSDKPNHVKLLLTDGLNGSFSGFHTGSGKWEWLTAVLKARDDLEYLRIHVSIFSEGKVYADGAKLVNSSNISFSDKDKDEYKRILNSNEVLLINKEPLDIKNYRMNNPHVYMQLPAPQANIVSVYHVRTYGGVNSSVDKRNIILLKNFVESGIGVGASSVSPDVSNERFLDLTGCRYDGIDRNKIRRSALSRFMLFKNYEVIKDDKIVLDRLKDTDFNPMQAIILNEEPNFKNFNILARKLDFNSIKTSEIEVKVKTGSSGLVFFNDSYHKDWKAYINGEEQPVIRANYNFMAVTVPAGESKVIFRFKPRFFYYGLYISLISILFCLICGYYFYRNKKKY
ncbi:YfhO family protein [bacterium]